MTTLILFLLGFGSVLIISAVETDPQTGQSVSIVQTIKNIWAGDVSTTAAPTTQNVTGGGSHPNFKVGSAGVTYGSAAGPAQQDAYRQAVVRAYLQARK